jgi:hypothetical protein
VYREPWEQSATFALIEESSYGRRKAKMVCFGPFKLDLKVGELHLNNRTVRLQEQLPSPEDVAGLSRPGSVSRGDLHETLAALHDCGVRPQHQRRDQETAAGTGDSAEEPKYVETVWLLGSAKQTR